MNKLKSFIARQPSYRLVIAGILLFIGTFLSPRYIGILPGVIGMATWFVLIGRAAGQSIAKRPDIKRPWWTNL